MFLYLLDCHHEHDFAKMLAGRSHEVLKELEIKWLVPSKWRFPKKFTLSAFVESLTLSGPGFEKLAQIEGGGGGFRPPS